MASSYIIGAGSRCFAGLQTAFGTAVTPDVLINMTSESIRATVSKEAEANLLQSKTATDADLTGVTVSGGISTLLRPEMADWLFEAAMGKKASNVFTLADPDDDIPVSTVILERGSIAKKYADMTISGITIRANAQRTVECDIDFVGVKEEADNSQLSTTSFAKKSYKCTAAYLKYKNNPSDAAAAEQPIETFTFSLSNGLEAGPKTYKSGLYAERPIKGQRGVSVAFTLPYSTDVETFKANYLTGANTVAMELKFTNGTDGENVIIELPNVAIGDVTGNVSGNGYIDGSISGIALSKGSTEPVTVMVNHTA